MGVVLTRQAAALLTALLLGAVAGVLYDALRLARYGRGRLSALLADALFCACAACGAFVFAMHSGSGRLGSCEILASLAGFVLYLNTLSRPVLKGFALACGACRAAAFRAKKLFKKSAISAKLLFQKMIKCFII